MVSGMHRPAFSNEPRSNVKLNSLSKKYSIIINDRNMKSVNKLLPNYFLYYRPRRVCLSSFSLYTCPHLIHQNRRFAQTPIPKIHFYDTKMTDRPTLVPPPPINPSKSAIENVLQLRELSQIGPVSIQWLSTL